MKALFVPADEPATAPTNHWLVVPLTTVQPLSVKVVPNSKPPSVAGLMSSVDWATTAVNPQKVRAAVNSNLPVYSIFFMSLVIADKKLREIRKE